MNTVPDAFGYWDFAVAAVSPIVVFGISKLTPKIPKVLIPSMTPLIGIVVGLTFNALAGAKLGWMEMGRAGALAVFVREVFNQAITKGLAAPTLRRRHKAQNHPARCGLYRESAVSRQPVFMQSSDGTPVVSD